MLNNAGLSSINEAVDFTVPILALPYSFDQYQNGYELSPEGFRNILDKESLARYNDKSSGDVSEISSSFFDSDL